MVVFHIVQSLILFKTLQLKEKKTPATFLLSENYFLFNFEGNIQSGILNFTFGCVSGLQICRILNMLFSNAF